MQRCSPIAFRCLALAVACAVAACEGDLDPGVVRAAGPLVAELDAALPEILGDANVPGLALAVIRDRELVWLRGYGLRRAGRPAAVGPDTVFEAGSMAKPLFAYAVLKLVESGALDLDTPLDEYLDAPYLPEYPKAAMITARMALTHTSGLQDLRDDWESGGRLRLIYEPGTHFFYSGEGFYYLQHAVERTTGRELADHLDATLLEPLGMTRSSYRWQQRFADDVAAGHTREGEPRDDRRFYQRANSAHTLYTTARDFARFLLEMLDPVRDAEHSLGAPALETMLRVQYREEANKSIRTLGWRFDPASGYVHHAGSSNMGFRCFSRFHPERGDGLLILTNGAGGGDAVRGPILEILDR